MKFQVLVGLVATLCVLDVAWTYPEGAPDQSCMDMQPMHHINKSYNNPLNPPQNSKPYFSIHVDRTWGLMPGEMVEVTIKADQYYFEGFLIQAHTVNTRTPQMLGEFTSFKPDTKLACSRQAVTHSEHKHYDDATMYWTVPAMRDDACVHFVATVVKGYSTYFMGVESEQVCFYGIDTGSMDSAPTHFTPLAAGLLSLVAMAIALFVRP